MSSSSSGRVGRGDDTDDDDSLELRKRQKLIPFPRIGKRQALIPFPRTGKRSGAASRGVRPRGRTQLQQQQQEEEEEEEEGGDGDIIRLANGLTLLSSPGQAGGRARQLRVLAAAGGAGSGNRRRLAGRLAVAFSRRNVAVVVAVAGPSRTRSSNYVG